MKNKFTIGEMSKLHNIPVKTLRYYDSIGLFKANAVDENNGYRYYSTEQFEQLDTIKYLKFLGLSLKEIHKHLETRDINSFITLLKRRQYMTNSMIRQLQLVSCQFSNRLNDLEQALAVKQIAEPFTKYLPKRGIISIDAQIDSEPAWELALRELANFAGGMPAFFIGRVGLTVAQKNIFTKRFDEYSSVFVYWEDSLEDNEFKKYLAEGNYACIYYRGNHSQSRSYYNKLLTFIDSKGYEITGDAVERTLIDGYITVENNLFLTEIQIPIK